MVRVCQCCYCHAVLTTLVTSGLITAGILLRLSICSTVDSSLDLCHVHDACLKISLGAGCFDLSVKAHTLGLGPRTKVGGALIDLCQYLVLLTWNAAARDGRRHLVSFWQCEVLSWWCTFIYSSVICAYY